MGNRKRPQRRHPSATSVSGSTRSVVAGPTHQVHTTANWALGHQTHPKRLCFTSPSGTAALLTVGFAPTRWPVWKHHQWVLWAHSSAGLLNPRLPQDPELQPGQDPAEHWTRRYRSSSCSREQRHNAVFMTELELLEPAFQGSQEIPAPPEAGCGVPHGQLSSKLKLQITQLCLTALPRTPRNLKPPTSKSQVSTPLIKLTDEPCHSGI